MSPIDTLFAQLRSQGRKALMPFVTAGDPDLDFTAAVLKELVARGASLCELGIPYSDPIADGPVIQASYTRALAKKIKLAQIFEMLKKTTGGQVPASNSNSGSPHPGPLPKGEGGGGPPLSSPTLAAPVVMMVSYAIIYRHGLRQYVEDAWAAGAAGAIVPDLPVEEAAELAQICRERDFSLIQLVTPTTPRERALKIAATSTGFIYYVSVTGITGERTQLPPDLLENVAWLRTQTPLPICIGFGISQPEHVKLLAPVADGLIVGSAIVRRIAEAEKRPREEVLRDVGEFAERLLAALG